MNLKKIEEAISIIKKHSPDLDIDIYAEHDQFWLCDSDYIRKGKDSERMIELGFFQDDEDNSWCCFT